MASKKNWIKGAIKNPGSLNAAAKRAGKSKSAFCKTAKGKNKARCTLWKALNKIRPSKKAAYGWEIK